MLVAEMTKCLLAVGHSVDAHAAIGMQDLAYALIFLMEINKRIHAPEISNRAPIGSASQCEVRYAERRIPA